MALKDLFMVGALFMAFGTGLLAGTIIVIGRCL